ncbi:MAG: acetyl/propionyl/methylcrotonyl-CoA carboxylase subunit alpha [Ilumatobacteraceae bacterium]
MRILIANRGEIARRVIRTARALGHTTIAVFADPDASAPFVAEADVSFHLGPADLASSYLSVERLLAAIAETGADAVHPGYGFLSENAAFAEAVVDAGCRWIGPRPEAIRMMGSKIEARRLAAAASVPIIPGFDESQDPEVLAQAADGIGYPVLVKAAAGGGGKGIRIVHEPEGFRAALAEAAAEAERSFGDASMIVERFIQRPRHVEVQIVGDRHGSVIHLGTRECSVQRRYQKLLEEAPAPNLPPETREGLHAVAVALASSIGYDSAGTVEFVVDDETGDYFFLEMNTRLQVEHPVTEEVTGFDLVELMIRVAEGEPLPITQDDVTFSGHAVEARVNAEDPANGFAPQIGTVSHLVVPSGVRWDSAVVAGSEVTPYYDAMVAKLIVSGSDRATALRRLGSALDELVFGGLVTNTGFQRWLIDREPVRDGRVTTRFLDETELPSRPEPAAAAAAEAWAAAVASSADHTSVWFGAGSFSLTPHRRSLPRVLVDADGVAHEVARGADSDRAAVASVSLADRSVAVNVDGYTQTFAVPSRSQRWAPVGAGGHGSARAVVAPFPGGVTEVAVSVGSTVAAGDPVVVIEAMKMLHTLTAAGPGTVEEVRVAVGDQVASNQVLVTFAAASDE